MNIINTKGSSNNFLNSVPLKIKGQNTIITKETVVDGQSQTTTIDGQTAYNELKTQQDTNTANIAQLSNDLNSDYYTSSQVDDKIDLALVSGVTHFNVNRAIYSKEDGTLAASLDTTRYDIETLGGLYNSLNTTFGQPSLSLALNSLQSDLSSLQQDFIKFVYDNKYSGDDILKIAKSDKFGFIKIANNLTTDSFDENNPIALSALKGYELQNQITSLQNNLPKIYNASFTLGSNGYYDVITSSTETSEAVYGLSPYTSSGTPVPTSSRVSYGMVPCWPEQSSDWFSSNGLNRIVLKKKGTYFIIMKMVMRPSYQNSNYSNISTGADIYNYFSRELTMRVKVYLQKWNSSTGAWDDLESAQNTTLQGSGAHDSDAGFFRLATTADNEQIQFRLFSNNPFREDNETILRSFGITILHLHSNLTD